jgi:hypothetical protein
MLLSILLLLLFLCGCRAAVGRLLFADRVRALTRVIRTFLQRVVGVFCSVELHAVQSLFFAQKSLSPRVPVSGTVGYSLA